MLLFDLLNSNSNRDWMIVESKEGKNLHLTHLEDLIFSDGATGARTALNYVDNVRQMLNQGGTGNHGLTVKWDGCVHADSLVITDQGVIPIKELVERHTDGECFRVLSFNFESNSNEYTEVINSVSKNGNKKWISVVLENDKTIVLTEDHEVYTTNRGWVQAKDLNETDDIKEIPMGVSENKQ